MATYVQPIAVQFGAALSGLAGSVGYTVRDSTGAVRIPRSGAGVTERPDAGGAEGAGLYEAAISVDPAWLPCRVTWDIAGQAGVVATEVIGGEIAALRAMGFTEARAALLDTLDGLVAAVWASADKEGYSLAPGGLEAVSAPPAVAGPAALRGSFMTMVRALFDRFYGRVEQTGGQQRVYNDAGALIATMACSDDGTTAVKGRSE